MKSLRLVLIAAVLSCMAVNVAFADGFKAKPKVIINVTLSQAVHNPGLVAAMHAQLNPGFLTVYQPLYVVEVNYNGAIYRIMGSYQLWMSFFFSKYQEFKYTGGGIKITE